MAPKAKPNGFSCFMFEYVDQQKRKGRIIPIAQATSECNPLWQAMDATKKAEYKTRSKTMNRFPAAKLANDGTVLSDFEERERAKAEMDKNLLAELKFRIEDTPRDHLADLKFYLIDVSLFCKTLKGLYIPAEISLLEFCVRKGTTSVLHMLIDPGDLPTGYLSDAMLSTDKVHRIPIPPYDISVTSVVTMTKMSEAYGDILEWIRDRCDGSSPVFCTWDDHIVPVRGVFETLAYRDDTKNEIRVTSVAALLYHLKNCSESDSTNLLPTLDIARELLRTDSFAQLLDIACKFHRSDDPRSDKVANCTLSQVQRLVYYICDHCCSPLNIKFRPDVHLPANNVPCIEEEETDDGWNMVPIRDQMGPSTSGRGRRGRRM